MALRDISEPVMSGRESARYSSKKSLLENDFVLLCLYLLKSVYALCLSPKCRCRTPKPTLFLSCMLYMQKSYIIVLKSGLFLTMMLLILLILLHQRIRFLVTLAWCTSSILLLRCAVVATSYIV